MNKNIFIFILMFLVLVSFASATCTVTFDDTSYRVGDSVEATMTCSGSPEKSKGYTLTWRDATTNTIVGTDTGTTPASTNTQFNEFYTILPSWVGGNTLSATLTGSSLEGSDTAVVYGEAELTTIMVTPTKDTILSESDDFQLTCSATNTGSGSASSVILEARYKDGATISTSTGNLNLDSSGTYSCGTLNEGASCSETWTVTGVVSSQNEIECYVSSDIDTDTSTHKSIHVFTDPISDYLILELDSFNYATGESVTAQMTSNFTEAPYNVQFYNSTGGLICDESGLTPTSIGEPFFSSCVLTNVSNQLNNSVVFFIDSQPEYNITTHYDISELSSLDYSVTNILLKYDTTYLGFSQSIKGTIIDSYGEIAIGECCRLQIDDANTGAPIYTSEDEYIDGAGSCETHWIMDKNIFEAPISYSAMLISWQCSDPTIPSASRKRGTGTTSFEVEEYIKEQDAFIPVVDTEVYAGFDDVVLEHERTNNFGQPIETLTTVWFANVDTEADYHYEYLSNEGGTINIGTSVKTHKFRVPEDLPSGTYRIEANMFYSYQGEIREFAFVKSADFNVTSIQDATTFDEVIIKDYFGQPISTNINLQDIASIPQSNNTDPYYVLSEGFGYQICADFTNTHEDNIFFHLQNLNIYNPTTGQSFEEFDGDNVEWKRVLPPGQSTMCWQSTLPLTMETHSDWQFNFDYYLGDVDEPYVCEDEGYLGGECEFSTSTPFFYVGAIEDMIVFDKWITKPTATSVGEPATYIVTEREEYLSMNDDCEYKSQSEIDWGLNNVTCIDKNDNTTELKIDYDKYPLAGEKFKVCYQIKNYFSDEVALELYDLYIDDDSGETVEYFQGEVTENYVPSITSDKVYLSEEPSREFEQQGILNDGYSNMCSKWLTLPTDIKGGNDWDIQGKTRIDTEIYNLENEINWRWESDEFPIFGLDDDKSSYLTANTITDESSYKIGDELYICGNVSSTYNEQLDIDVYYNYRCSATQQDDETDRTLFGSWTEIRGINGVSSQNQCHKFIIPDDTYIRSQGTLNCYATTTIHNDEVAEETTTSSSFFTISRHEKDLTVVPSDGNYNMYIAENFDLNITMGNPLGYRNERLEAHYSIGIMSEGALVYLTVDEIEFEVGESSKTFQTKLPIRDSVVYSGDKRNWDLGGGWIEDKKQSFLQSIQSGDKGIELVIDYHFHADADEGQLGSETVSFEDIFSGYTFQDPGKTSHTTINSGQEDGSSTATELYLNDQGELDFYIYFNLSSESAPDGTYSTNERETWAVIEGTVDEDSNKLCRTVKDYTYLNGEGVYNEYWIKMSCSYEDSQQMVGKTVKFFRQGAYSSNPYKYDNVDIKHPIVVNSIYSDKTNYVGGEVVYVVANVSGYDSQRFKIDAVLESEDGLEVYEWESDIENFHIKYGTNQIIFPLLLPTSMGVPYTGDYELEIYLRNLYNNKIDIKEGIDINVQPFVAIISENITSTTIDNDNPITIDYELNIPLKSMEYFPNANQPFRIQYHFLNEGGQAFTQFETIDGQYAPLEAYSLFPADSQQNFSVVLQPTNLDPGTYRIVETVQIDPPINGVPVWETVSKGEIGTFVVTETLVGEPKGLVQTASQTYNLANTINTTTKDNNILAKEINVTTHEILDLMQSIDVVIADINNTINNLDFSGLEINLSEINMTDIELDADILQIQLDLQAIRTEMLLSNQFQDELIFLVTDSIIAVSDSRAGGEVKVEKLLVAEEKMIELKTDLSNKSSTKSGLILFGTLILLSTSTLMVSKNIKKKKKGKEDNDDKLFDSLSKRGKQ